MGFFFCEGHDVCPMQHQKESACVPKPGDSSAQSTGEFALMLGLRAARGMERTIFLLAHKER